MGGNSSGKSILWLRLRRASQFFILLLFFFLFIKTDYNGTDELQYGVNIFFRLDPLIATCAMFAGKTLITLFLPALVTVLLTILLGRFYCGWFCPLGTLLDLTNRLWRGNRRELLKQPASLKYIILAVIITGAFFGLPLVGYFDPLSLLVRGMTLSLYPAFNSTVTSFFTMTYQFGYEWLNLLTEPLYSVLKETVLPFKQKQYNLSLLSLGLLLTPFLLERYGRRFFCRNICPLGAFLGIIARWSFLRGSGGSGCEKCTICRSVCRMDAINDKREVAPDKCNLCIDCLVLCPQKYINFRFGSSDSSPEFATMSRRAFIGSVITAVVAPSFLSTRVISHRKNPFLIRPPGALAEKDFLGGCVRCGECMKVCINNALHPVFLESGVEGVFTPKFLFRHGYCEYNCTLCGQVCPSGAIEKLSVTEKQNIVVGVAQFDKNRCLPYAKGIPCIVCEEHCPTPDKAIKFRSVTVKNMKGNDVFVKQPFIVDKLCIGCGICENKCPLPGNAAVIVLSDSESREKDDNFGGGSYSA